MLLALPGCANVLDPFKLVHGILFGEHTSQANTSWSWIVFASWYFKIFNMVDRLHCNTSNTMVWLINLFPSKLISGSNFVEIESTPESNLIAISAAKNTNSQLQVYLLKIYWISLSSSNLATMCWINSLKLARKSRTNCVFLVVLGERAWWTQQC